MVYIGIDEKAGKLIFEKPKKVKPEKEEKETVHLPESLVTRLKQLATRDGFKSIANTEQGAKAQATRVVQRYVEIAVKRFLEAREAEVEEPEETEG